MIYLYFPRVNWIAICTLLTLTGARGDGEINSIFDTKNGLNFGYSKEELNTNNVAGTESLERNKRALQEIYLIREKKESEDPMNYLSKLYSDLEDSSRGPFQNVMTAAMVEGIVDPPQIELQFHKKVPNCGSEFNITKIIELVDDDKKQRICPCTQCQMSKPDDQQQQQQAAEQAAESMQADAQAGPAAAEPPQPPPEAPPIPSSPAPIASSTCGDDSGNEFSAEATTPNAVAQAGQMAVISKAEVPGPKEAPKPAEPIKAPKPDQTKAAISQKKVEDTKRTKTPPQRAGQQPTPPRIGPPLSRVIGGDANKKGGPMLQPRPPAAANAPGIRPPNNQMKNALKTPQQIANKPLHSKMPEGRGPAKGPAAPGHAPQKLMNAKQPIANPGWDLAEPGAAYPGLYQFRQP